MDWNRVRKQTLLDGQSGQATQSIPASYLILILLIVIRIDVRN
jgi:hypothetical protein